MEASIGSISEQNITKFRKKHTKKYIKTTVYRLLILLVPFGLYVGLFFGQTAS